MNHASPCYQTLAKLPKIFCLVHLKRGTAEWQLAHFIGDMDGTNEFDNSSWMMWGMYFPFGDCLQFVTPDRI